MNQSLWRRLPATVARCAALSLLTSALVDAKGSDDISGTVTDSDGHAVQGATAFIYTAGPKQGVGVLCPSCYKDCAKRAKTDAEGKFKIEDLDPTLLFRLLIVSDNYQPKFVSKVDPAAEPVQAILKERRKEAGADRQIKGRVLSSDNQAISDAVITLRGVTRGRSTRFGGNEDVDEIAVTSEDGTFVINGETAFDAIGLDVQARGFAKGIFTKLASGGTVHELKLSTGATVKGRLARQGQGVRDVEIGVSGADRTSDIFVGSFSVATDDEGRFVVPNLPPQREYFITAKMNSTGGKGAAPSQRIKLREDGSVLDVGDVVLADGLRLEGDIKLTDGKPLPSNVRVLLSREEAWDSVQTEADEKGHFKFNGVPAESLALSIRIKGYRLTSRNKSLDTLNSRLLGVLKADKTDLVVEFEPGEKQERAREYIDIRHEPLLGVEESKSRSGDFHVVVTALDADSQQPLSAFTITEGQADSFGKTFQWLPTRRTKGMDGKAEVFLTKGRMASAIMVESEGYLPQASAAITDTESAVTFKLHKGKGPNGKVLKPDGTPAANAEVFLLNLRNTLYFRSNTVEADGRISRGVASSKSDEEGRFSFPAGVDDFAILIANASGFAQVRVQDLTAHPEVRLAPWGRIEGKLLIGEKPGAGEEIRLGLMTLPHENDPRVFPPISLHLITETDKDGRFTFDRVPPINVQVYHSPHVRDGEMGTISMSQTTSLAMQPGEVRTITMGGKGRPVTGKVVVNGYSGKINWRADAYYLESILPPVPELADSSAKSGEQIAKIRMAESEDEKKRLIGEYQKDRDENTAKERAFYMSEKGREYFFQTKRYALNFTQDGAFRVEDVPGGKYRLRIDLREGNDPYPARLSAPRIASLNSEFEIAESPGGRTNEPFDVGTVETGAKKVIKVGDHAPEFEIKTVAGKTVKLSDMAGKYVLLDFWAVWCGPCVGETPNLKATFDAFKNDPRFQMIGLSLDPDLKAPKDYAEKKELGWIQGFLGDWSKTDVPNRYGVEGIPSIFLVGPEGNVIAKDLRGERIKEAVEHALGEHAPAKNR